MFSKKEAILLFFVTNKIVINSNKYTAEQLIEALAAHDVNLKESLPINKTTVVNIGKKLLPNKLHGQRLDIAILLSMNLKYCRNCRYVKGVDDFVICAKDTTNLQSYCKSCQLGYQRENKDIWVMSALKRNKDLLQRTPAWANLQQIAKIYKECPAGYHVDHIIPLRGEIVCGLHVETNLQYLTAEENIKKSNKFISP